MEDGLLLSNGDLLVMNGLAQGELLHQTDPGLKSQRINLTFRLNEQHVDGLHTIHRCDMMFTILCAWFICSADPLKGTMGIPDNLFRPPDIWGFVSYWPPSGWPRLVGGPSSYPLLLNRIIGSTCISESNLCGEMTCMSLINGVNTCLV